jgi:hypothetical protein
LRGRGRERFRGGRAEDSSTDTNRRTQRQHQSQSQFQPFLCSAPSGQLTNVSRKGCVRCVVHGFDLPCFGCSSSS